MLTNVERPRDRNRELSIALLTPLLALLMVLAAAWERLVKPWVTPTLLAPGSTVIAVCFFFPIPHPIPALRPARAAPSPKASPPLLLVVLLEVPLANANAVTAAEDDDAADDEA